jgi:hypothetical protein
VDLEKENLWFTAGHLCLGEDTLTISADDQKIEAQVKGVNSKYDWCYLTTELTNGPGYYLHDTFSNSESTVASLYAVSTTITLPWADIFSDAQLFGIKNYTGLHGDSGSPLLVDGYLRGIQIELSQTSIIFFKPLKINQ